MKLESTDKIRLKNAVLGNTLEKKLWGLFRIESAASSSLRNSDFGAFSLPSVSE